MKSSLFRKKLFWVLAILVLFVTVASVLLNSNLGIDDYETLPSIEEYTEIYSEVIERNRIMLENPIEYGDKFCSGYLSTTPDLDLHKSILNDLQILSDEICKNAENDYEKVRAITYWVAENIFYNHVAADSEVNADIISLEYVLKTKTATCAGYSNMFSALCNMQGIYCVNLRGGTHDKMLTAEYLMSVPVNHEWNAAMVDGEWIFVDTTWMSGNDYTENGYEQLDDLKEQYFDISFEEMSFEHRIDIIDYRNFKMSIRALE